MMARSWVSEYRLYYRVYVELLHNFCMLSVGAAASIRTAFRQASWLCGSAQEKHLLLLSGPAGATLEDHLACFALQARMPSRYHADRLPSLWLPAGLMAHQTPLPGLACSAAMPAQSSSKHRHSPSPHFTHSPPDVRPSFARSLVPTPFKTVDQNPPPPSDGMGKACTLRCELNLLGRPCGAGCANEENR